MTIIELTNHNQLPPVELIGYILFTPEQAAIEHAKKYGKAEKVYRVTRRNIETLFIPKEGGENETA